MKKTFKGILLAAFIVLGAFMLQKSSNQNCADGLCGVFPNALAENSSLIQSDLPTGEEQISFVELGSVNCIPCKKMQPIMEEIKKEYTGKVKVIFHDVWTNEGKQYGQEYGIRLIPTQVFFDKAGKEITRHEGFFPKLEIEKILNKAGISK